MGLAAFFFAAATNTLAGWLYVMSGVLLGLLAIAAILPPRNLSGLEIERQPIRPVSAGEALLIDLTLTNSTRQAKALLQVWDGLPAALAPPQRTAVAAIAPGRSHRWTYEVPTQRRGLYRWQTVALRTAAPLGLFWCRRSQTVSAMATVYPQILPLNQCALVDTAGQDSGQQWHAENAVQLATEGITRSMRPYRWGDSTRLIHWRSSARYGELRVRELEKITAGQQVVIALDTASAWDSEAFEQAVVAAASLYIYALRRGFSTALWTPENKLTRNKLAVLTVLAEILPRNQALTAVPAQPPPLSGLPAAPILWLTPQLKPKGQLPPGSRQICWAAPSGKEIQSAPILWIRSDAALQPQLQAV
ncbi:DUF58 domain-containing protein [Pseudanabaena sp. FACHB-2040]|nr:DUF58 domain-containing protein [Pseudanabaena sp. FACHB-2040]